MSTLAPPSPEVAPEARRGALLTMALAVAVGSVSFTMIKLVLRDISPLALAAGRVVFSASAFLMIVIAQPQRRRPIAREDRVRVLFCGLGGSAGFHLLFSWGQDHVSVAVAAVVLATMPAMVALGEVIFMSHRLSARQIAGLLLSLVGVAVISLQSSGGRSTLLGILAVAGATVVWAAVTSTTRSLADRYDPWWLNTPGTVLGALVMIALALPHAREYGHLAGPSWAYLIWLGMVGSAFIYAALAHAMKSLSATVTSSLSTLVTPVGVIVAWIGLGERPGLITVAGGTIAVLGVGLVTGRA
ncbi:MAG: eamA-like transporter family protein [Ilumatobacteraceae bacterium]|nr:eamA-like transporter family protein [Ilumatobacteraceae bacterium]